IAIPIQSVTTRDPVDTTAKSTPQTAGVQKATTDAPGKKKESMKPEEVVFVVSNGIAKTVPVKTGIQDDEFIEIKSGLKGDEQVITGPFSAISRLLKSGDAVKVVEKDKLFNTDTK
ncbi:MAG TPA: efflux transporter periplasmic adaptor subunit, partial [Chitinophagales bacterium]|nr:efflux transporter periplasmic adaptor subunit [Chitinophagales bacterium]